MRFALCTATLFLALAPAVFCADDDSILFSDDFTSFDPGWGEPTAIKQIGGGKFLLKPEIKGYHFTEFNGSTFTDIDGPRVKVSLKVAGAADEPGGLVFWANPDNDDFYAASFQSNGDCTVARTMNGKWLNPVPWKHSDAIKQGPGPVNEIRVVTQGKSATVYFNGTALPTFKGFPPTGGSFIGVYGESGDDQSTWQFTDLVVRKPQ